MTRSDSEQVTPFVAVEGQSFATHQHWVIYATQLLTGHPQYNNTEHGDTKSWRGEHFTTMCFDQKGRRVRNGGDFRRADDEGTFPVWWVWPDQIAELIMSRQPAASAEEKLRAALEEVADHLRAEADKDKYGPSHRALIYSAARIDRALLACTAKGEG